MSRLRVEKLTVGPLQENCWLLSDPVSGGAVLVDPGEEAPRILKALAATGCALRAVWLTHAHFDHVGALAAVLREHDVPVLLHPLDEPLYAMAVAAAARWGIVLEAPPAGVTRPLAEGDSVTLGAYRFDVWHVPGHAPGHVAFIGHGLCLSGDLLFAGSIGRTDLPLCDPAAMRRSLERVAGLPGNMRVLPGHGPDTTIGAELAGNPFLRGVARPVGGS